MRAGGAAVGRATDMLQALVPPSTPRAKVETAVKGALTLLALALVKSVLSVSRGAAGAQCAPRAGGTLRQVGTVSTSCAAGKRRRR